MSIQAFPPPCEGVPAASACLEWCFYCGARVAREASFCYSCLRTAVHAEDVKAPIGSSRSIARKRSAARRGSVSFVCARRPLGLERAARKALIAAALLVVAVVPYYAACKAFLGDSFPGKLGSAVSGAAVSPGSADLTLAPVLAAGN